MPRPAGTLLWRGLASGARRNLAHRYAITSLEEVRAYLRHPLLEERLRASTQAANRVKGRSAREVFGSPDDIKFRSCMTLLDTADPRAPEFRAALATYFGGQGDPFTLEKRQVR